MQDNARRSSIWNYPGRVVSVVLDTGGRKSAWTEAASLPGLCDACPGHPASALAAPGQSFLGIAHLTLTDVDLLEALGVPHA